MNSGLVLVPVGSPEPELMDWLSSELSGLFHTPCVLQAPLDVTGAYHPERKQHHSSELLTQLSAYVTPRTWRVLGVTQVDLYLPILTFVFGEAHFGGNCALVSYHRLRQEFYGLPPDRDLLAARLLIECVHEIGHTMHLPHCHDYQCVMSSSHSVEWIDLKEPRFCEPCSQRALVHG